MIRTIQFFVMLFSASLFAQLEHYDWPTGTGEAKLSDKYQVFVKLGSNPEEEIEVLMSEADPNDLQYDFQENELTGRTFSYAAVSYNNIANPALTFRIVKTFGNTSTTAEITPKSYNITPTFGNNEVSFSIQTNNKYISVNFDDTANETTNQSWIKHMLTIYVDPPEENKPTVNGSSVVEYSNSLSPTALQNATTLYFPAGYHNLRDYPFASNIIDSDGIIYLNTNKQIYLEGGAFVEGLVSRTAFNTSNQKLFGRGVLSGRQYEWQLPDGTKPYGEIVRLGEGAEIQGVHLLDTPKHGIVGRDNMLVENIKFLGWHANNDGIRIGSGSEIRNSFMRCVDDFFYNYNIYVHDCVFWAGHNGAILTYGWASIDTGSSFFEDIDIINPEWTGLGNNNSIIAAQVALDFNVIDYGTGETTTTFKNMRIEGSIPGLTNIKPRTSGNGTLTSTQVSASQLGYLGDVHFENITIENQFGKGLLKGQANATPGGDTYYTKNVNFTNLTIGGTKVHEGNKSLFFNIEESTTQNITFDPDDGSSTSDTYTETFDTVTLNNVLQDGSNPGLDNSYFSQIPAGDGEWYSVQGFGNTDFGIQNSGGNTFQYVSRISTTQFARGLAYVYNNTDESATGLFTLNFDYFFNTSFDNSSATNERFGYRIWGINSDTPDGTLVLSGGSGDFGDSFATDYDGTDGVDLTGGHTHLTHSDSWTNSGDIIIDMGAAGTYDYFIFVFGQVFGTAQNGNPVEDYFGIDNVVLPTQSNPQSLSTKDFKSSQLLFYPNPVSDVLTLQNITGDYSYKIYDISGKVLKTSKRETSKRINLSHLNNGLYFLEVINSVNERSTAKIIKN